MNATWIDSVLLRRRRRRPSMGPGYSFLELSSATVRMREAGDGALTLLFAADPPNVLEHYDELLRQLEGWARVVVFEAPGFGLSVPRPGYTFTRNEQAELVTELIVRLGARPCVLVFPCVTAFAALQAAHDRPDLVSALVLTQAPSFVESARWARRVDPHGVIAMPVIGQIFMAAGKRWVTKRWYAAALPEGHPTAPFAQPALRAFDEGGTFCLASAFQHLFAEGRPMLATVAAPTLVVWGSADRTHRRTTKRSISEHVPAAQVLDWPDTGHFPELEQPRRFAEEIRTFLRR